MSSVAPLLARRPLADRVFLAGVALWAASILPSLLPVLPPEWTFTYADQFSDVPVLLFILVLTVWAARRSAAHRERTFWAWWSAAVGAVLLVRGAYVLVPESFWFGEGGDLVEDGLYVASYLCAALAVETRPDRTYPRDVRARLASVERTGVLVAVSGLLVYFVLVPRLFAPEVYASWVPSLFLFAALDLALAARYWHARRSTTRPVWRAVYTLLAATFLLWGIADGTEGLLYLEFLPWVDPGTPFDLLWHLPPLALLAAVRARRWAPTREAEDASTSGERVGQLLRTFEPEPSRLGVLALAIPTLHLALTVAGGRDPALTYPRDVTVLVTMAALIWLMTRRNHLLCRVTELLDDDRRAVLNQLHAAQRMEAVGRLASGVAHDFSNIVSIIRGRAEVLLHTGQVARGGREDVEEIVDASERGESLVRSLLALSRNEPTRAEALDAWRVCGALEPILQRVLPDSVELKLAPPGRRPPTVFMERVHLEQIVLNLAVNARDALPHGGRVDVEIDVREVDDRFAAVHGAATGGVYTVLRVADSGPGVRREIRPFIFEPLFTTKGEGEGSGLGLAVVYSVAKRYGGFARVDDAPSGGAMFEVYLPWHDVSPPGGAELSPALAPPNQETVLIVEGDAGVRGTAARVLAHAGYHVLEAAAGGEALEILERRHQRVGVLVASVVLTDMTGAELVRRARRNDAGLAAVLMGLGFGAHGDALPRGVPVVRKPFTPADLVHAVHRARTVRLVRS